MSLRLALSKKSKRQKVNDLFQLFCAVLSKRPIVDCSDYVSECTNVSRGASEVKGRGTGPLDGELR